MSNLNSSFTIQLVAINYLTFTSCDLTSTKDRVLLATHPFLATSYWLLAAVATHILTLSPYGKDESAPIVCHVQVASLQDEPEYDTIYPTSGVVQMHSSISPSLAKKSM